MRALAIVLMLTIPLTATAEGKDGFPPGYWDLAAANAILEKTRRVAVAPDLSHLSPAARAAMDKLLAAGVILHDLYEDATHEQALAARAQLASLPAGQRRDALFDLNWIFRGPIATTLENERQPFLPVEPQPPGRNVYPWDVDREQLEAYMARVPESRDELLGVRTVVRAADAASLARDLSVLDAHPMLDGLHPGLRARLNAHLENGDPTAFYALPYSVRWPDRFLRLHALLTGAAADISAEDPDFAAYLRLRARDFLTDDYEAGDAAWVTGRFGSLNAQIGSYETYDDALYGVKSFFSLSLLAREDGKSRELESAIGGIQAIQDSLPQARERKVREDISVGVYNVIADFGQSRGTNTATILPNEAAQSRKYGRTILLRYNIMTNPELFADSLAIYQSAVEPAFAGDLTLDGNFYRTLWHEIGHYLGVDRTDDERELDAALAPWGDLYEEMKADLVSLHTAPRLQAAGILDEDELRSIRASGIRRVLQRVKPRRDQPYQTMQLMQMNYFLAHGLLDWNEDSGRLSIDYERYDAVVEDLLREVLAIQADGDADAATAFVERHGGWDEALHGRLAERLRGATPYRYRLVDYAVLER